MPAHACMPTHEKGKITVPALFHAACDPKPQKLRNRSPLPIVDKVVHYHRHVIRENDVIRKTNTPLVATWFPSANLPCQLQYRIDGWSAQTGCLAHADLRLTLGCQPPNDCNLFVSNFHSRAQFSTAPRLASGLGSGLTG